MIPLDRNELLLKLRVELGVEMILAWIGDELSNNGNVSFWEDVHFGEDRMNWRIDR